MSTVRAQVTLSVYTTLGLGGPAGAMIDAASDEQIVSAVRAADREGEPVLVLGGGSNLVVGDDGFPGTVVRIASRGVTVTAPGDGGSGDTAPSDTAPSDTAPSDSGAVTVTAAAGEQWDRLVEWSVREGLAGLECLSGIPGLVGATPIQNVGAYGQDVSETITRVRAFDRQRDEVVTLTAAECGFGYRTSMFKRAALASAAAASASAENAVADRPAATAAGMGVATATGRFVVLDVTFRLRRQGRSAPVRYAELAARLDVATGDSVPLADARSAVLALRRGKGMVLDPADPDTRNAGSFFTNPVLTTAQFAELERRAADRCGPDTPVPHFGADGEMVKVPAAWLIERAGFTKGYPGSGTVRISTKHTLALTHRGGGNTATLLALAGEIKLGVKAAFGVELANEPVLVGATL
jgi:UDP-N-acetylmuramate dehydrogenase